MEPITGLLPADVPLWAAGVVVVASFFTAALTAAFGLGGGLALLAVMSTVFPAPAVVPIHGAAQAGANGGRFYLQRKEVVWRIVLWFSLGALIGAAIGGRLAVEAPVWLLRAGVGLFVIWTLWGPKLKGFAAGPKTFFATGVATGILTMFFGATGPLVAAMLSVAGLSRLHIVATHAAAMVIQHIFKIVAFGLLGFAYGEWAWLIGAILVSGFGGTYVGTHYLRAMPEETFRRGFKFILTAIAVYLLIAAAIDFRTG
jgi:uncharacterized protein